MTRRKIVERAEIAPGKCVLTGAGDGPLVDTNVDYQDYRGRIYVSIRGMAEYMREVGWEDADTVAALRRTVAQQDQDLGEMADRVARLEALERAVQGLVDPVVEERTVKEFVTREPTEDEVREWILDHPSDPIISSFRQPPPGSAEEYRRLYGRKMRDTESRKRELQLEAEKTQPAQAAAKAQEGSEVPGNDDPNAPPSHVVLYDNTIDLDDLLSNGVKDVVAYMEGKPEDFQLAVMARETWSRQGSPRKTLISAINKNLKDA